MESWMGDYGKHGTVIGFRCLLIDDGKTPVYMVTIDGTVLTHHGTYTFTWNATEDQLDHEDGPW